MELSEQKVQAPQNIELCQIRQGCIHHRRRQWHPTPVLLPGNPMDRGAWWAAVHGVTKSRTRQRLRFHFSLSCIGKGNGNPLQCSCLENPRDNGAWWAAVYGVAQSRTQLKWLSSSSNRIFLWHFFPNWNQDRKIFFSEIPGCMSPGQLVTWSPAPRGKLLSENETNRLREKE